MSNHQPKSPSEKKKHQIFFKCGCNALFKCLAFAQPQVEIKIKKYKFGRKLKRKTSFVLA